MTDPKSANLKGGVPPSPPKTRYMILTISLAGVLISLLAIYFMARPFITYHGNLDFILIVGIALTVIAYASVLKGGVPPSPPKTRIIASILIVGIVVSLVFLYRIAKPFVENHGSLDLALIAGIIFSAGAFAMALKGGVPPAPPKKVTGSDGGVIPPPSPQAKAKPIKGGIPPATRKPNV